MNIRTSRLTVHCFDRECSFEFRPNTSDRTVINQVFAQGQYDLRQLPCWEKIDQRYRRLISAGHRPVIIDAGANIGAATVWFSAMFPEATILAIEPAASNVSLLRRNATSATIVEAALSSSRGRAAIINPLDQPWEYRTEPTDDPAGVPRVTVRDLIAQSSAVPFIIKIDIEGSEADLFAADTGWIGSTPIIIIELHDWLIPGSGAAYRRAMQGRHRVTHQLGENVVSVALSPQTAFHFVRKLRSLVSRARAALTQLRGYHNAS